MGLIHIIEVLVYLVDEDGQVVPFADSDQLFGFFLGKEGACRIVGTAVEEQFRLFGDSLLNSFHLEIEIILLVQFNIARYTNGK